ncbi:Outer membrane protein transport protein (OMPP1/FadL/TodX) [compost metagenome]
MTKGSGINGRIGVIFRPLDNLRLGATLQTPSWFLIDDSYTEQVDNRGTIRGSSGDKTYDFSYNLRTPLKASLGASYIIAGQALLAADIDFVDYASTRLSPAEGSSSSQLLSDNNTTIRRNFTNAINYRVGLEYKIDALSLRGGYALNGSPYKSDSAGLFEAKTYSGGLGYRTAKYYVDLTYQRQENTSTFSPYTLSNGNEPVANMDNTQSNLFLTFGLRF